MPLYHLAHLSSQLTQLTDEMDVMHVYNTGTLKYYIWAVGSASADLFVALQC